MGNGGRGMGNGEWMHRKWGNRIEIFVAGPNPSDTCQLANRPTLALASLPTSQYQYLTPGT